MTVCWGQNASNGVFPPIGALFRTPLTAAPPSATGELGLGPDEPKSATKPTRNIPLNGLDVVDIAAGQNTTVLLVRSSDTFSEMPRHPVEVEPPEACVGCGRDYGDPLECDKCDGPWHLECLDPPLDGVPDGEWFCPDCGAEPGAPVGPYARPRKRRTKSGVGAKRGRALDEEEDRDEVRDERGNREFNAVVVWK